MTDKAGGAAQARAVAADTGLNPITGEAIIMRSVLAVLLASLLCTAAVAEPASAPVKAQLERLSALLSDGHAVGLIDDAETQVVNAGADDEMLLALFVVEGHGGGNGYVQYLAAFTPGTDADGKPWYSLIDVLPVGGKGWRALDGFAPRVTKTETAGTTRLAFDVLENAGEDAPNFPSRKARLVLELRDGRLFEAPAR